VITRAVVCGFAAGGVAAAALMELAAARREAAARDRNREPRPSRERARPAAAGFLLALAGLGRRIGGPAAPPDLATRLEAAGSPLGLTPPDVMAIKAGAALVGLLLALGPAQALPGRLGVVMLVVAPAAGFVIPDLWLRRQAARRAHAMALELADVLDLLRMGLDAGLSVGRALAEVGRRRGGLLSGELAAAAERLALGVPRDEWLGRLVRRCPLSGVAALAAAIDRCERHGAPLAPALDALAAEARAQRARARIEHAARASPKIQLVVALLLVPSVLLLVAAALVRGLVGD
jgi:tight adherence protein C